MDWVIYMSFLVWLFGAVAYDELLVEAGKRDQSIFRLIPWPLILTFWIVFPLLLLPLLLLFWLTSDLFDPLPEHIPKARLVNGNRH